MKRLCTLIAALLIAATSFADGFAPAEKAHPRLILKSGDFDLLRTLVSKDSAIERLHSTIAKRAETYLTEPVCERVVIGRRLLGVSRKVLERVSMLSYMYHYTGDVRYAERAEQEMLAAANFCDWNPSHFLDVGEMTTALAIGYDWLYNVLSESSRATIAEAIAEKGLRAADKKKPWFYKSVNNWNSVCNAGLTMGAIAVADLYPDLAKAHIAKSLKSNHLVMPAYGPDGVYPEGYGYWDYGTWYQVLMIESLRSVGLDTEGLEKYPGFIESARFLDYMQSFDNRTYNFSDNVGARDMSNPLLYWFAAESGDMSLLWNERRITTTVKKLRIGGLRQLPIAMLFIPRCDLSKVAPNENRCWSGNGKQPIFICRDRNFYLAAKGGSPSLPHAHMDGGSFIYEWGGQRWASELGMQNYHSLEKVGVKLWAKGQESQRWDVFRLSLDSHNTLMVNDKQQRYDGSAKMIENFTEPKRSGVVFDMSSLYFDLERAVRTIEVNAEGRLLVTDEMTSGAEPCRVRWTMCTPAKPMVLSRTEIELEQNGRKMLLRVVSPTKGVEPFVLPNTPRRSYDAPNKGTLRVGFYTTLTDNKSKTLQIELVPID